MTLTDIKSLETIDAKVKLILSKQVSAILFDGIDYEKELSKNFSKLRDNFPKAKV